MCECSNVRRSSNAVRPLGTGVCGSEVHFPVLAERYRNLPKLRAWLTVNMAGPCGMRVLAYGLATVESGPVEGLLALEIVVWSEVERGVSGDAGRSAMTLVVGHLPYRRGRCGAGSAGARSVDRPRVQ